MDLLQVLVYIYSVPHVKHKFREEEEERLKSVLGEAILFEGQGDNLDPVLHAIFRRCRTTVDWSKLEIVLYTLFYCSVQPSLLECTALFRPL